MKILILDDDPLSTKALQATLANQWPGGVLVTNRCEDALKALVGPHYIPLFVMDLQLPDGDGLSVAQRARESGYLSTSELAVVTASPYRESVLRAKQLGVNHFMVKPLAPDGIKQMLARSLAELNADVGFLMQLLGFFRKVDVSQLTESAVSQFYHMSLLSKVPSVSNALERLRSYMAHRHTKQSDIEDALNALRLHCELLIGRNKTAVPLRA